MTLVEERVGFADPRIFTMRELNQRTADVLKAINKSGEPAVITRHGRFVALITPLEGRNLEGRLVAAMLKDDRLTEPADADTDEPSLSTDELADNLGFDV